MTHEWIEDSIDKYEMPVAGSPKSLTKYSYPMTCVRELIANALCHRDYESSNITYVSLYSDRIEIQNPGRWAGRGLRLAGQEGSIRVGQEVLLKDIDEKCNPPNSGLALALSAIDLVEMLGSGIIMAVRDCERHHAPYPTIAEDGAYVLATVRPCGEWMSSAELLVKWRAGDAESGRKFIKEHSTPLKRFFERKVARDSVKELLIATFVRCCDASDHVMERSSTFSSFLFKTAREVLLSELSQLPASSLAKLPAVPSLGSVSESNVGKIIIEALRQQELEAQILVDLVLFHRLSPQEASEVIEARVSAAKRQLREVLQALAEHIRGHETESDSRSKALEFVGFLE